MAPSKAEGSSSDRPVSTQVSEDTPAELSAVVDELLSALTSKFSTVSSEIFTKMDDMSKRLDNLEVTIQANSESKSSPTKP